jgi:chromosome segregation protein
VGQCVIRFFVLYTPDSILVAFILVDLSFLFSTFYLLSYTERMQLKSLELTGFKSFGKKSELEFSTPITAVVGPNGSGKSNAAESFRFVLGEQSMKSLRGKKGEDLIWGGSGELPRANRASVKLVFDNKDRLVNIDFDEVAIERVVYRDGVNEYLLNGSKVRLKDITEMLAGANIGASGHHIISQGEADRVLAASPRERKQMIEDALGLRIYQYKKDESQKKLEKTRENKAQVEALRRENGPHLKFLERQVKKLEKARELRVDLVRAYHEYLKREEQYLTVERESLSGARDEPTRKLKEANERVQEIREQLEEAKKGDRESEELLSLEKNLSKRREEQASHTRAVGRIEGQIAFEERRLEEEAKRAAQEEGQPVPYREARDLWEDLTHIFDHAQGRSGVTMDAVVDALHKAQSCLAKFIERHVARSESYEPDTRELDRLRVAKNEAESEIDRVVLAIQDIDSEIRALKETVEKSKDENRGLERELFSLMAAQTEIRSTLSRVDALESTLRREEEEFKREIGEGIALIGRDVMGYKDIIIPESGTIDLDANGASEERTRQYERKRELEKLKIRLEEMGGASADEITKEYTEVKERDEFLERELVDLDKSTESLENLIKELEKELSDRFKKGVEDIGKQFGEFFTLMFGGGSAKLTVVAAEKKRRGIVATLLGEDPGEQTDDDGSVDPVAEEGVEVEVSLPKKRVQSLLMLSGGERTLTSIALIFAMSQVNPPPFLILDETDAALDEANSRRYGDMITNLSQKSQLILITHNRETMSRAGVLYGITMGMDGVSRVLTVKLDDAVAVAK